MTDPLLLDAVEDELRGLRFDGPLLPSGPTQDVRRIETPFSGAVDVPLENVIGPNRPDPTVDDAWRGASIDTPADRSQRPADPRPTSVGSSAPGIPAPPPVPARLAAVQRPLGSTGPVIVPTHRPSPVPVEPARDSGTDEDPQRRGPVGFSVRTALLSAGLGLVAATVLSVITLIPR